MTSTAGLQPFLSHSVYPAEHAGAQWCSSLIPCDSSRIFFQIWCLTKSGRGIGLWYMQLYQTAAPSSYNDQHLHQRCGSMLRKPSNISEDADSSLVIKVKSMMDRRFSGPWRSMNNCLDLMTCVCLLVLDMAYQDASFFTSQRFNT